MSNNRTASPTAAAAERELTRGRMTLLLIAGIPVIVILASTWMWYYVSSGELDVVGVLGTSNRGDLVQPPRLALDADWVDQNGEPFSMSVPRRWSIVVPQHGTNCDANCEQRLYQTRQIHMALGKALGRVQRVLVVDDDVSALALTVPELSDQRPMPDSFSEYLSTEQLGMTVWQASTESFGPMFREYLSQPDSWYLMDPAGWVMMRYDNSVSYKDVISDMKFLIKNSNG